MKQEHMQKLLNSLNYLYFKLIFVGNRYQYYVSTGNIITTCSDFIFNTTYSVYL